MPATNFFGFGPADLVEIALAALLLGMAIVWRDRVMLAASHLAAARPAWCMALLAALPVVLRLLLLPNHPVPRPEIYDEFSHLLVADTLRHFRLANPPHPLPQFFETFFVLQRPTYSSIYPLGQGLMLAIGWTFFGTPWAGVLLAIAAFCALCYWMLRGWTTPGWALLGGVLAAIEFGPLNQWMNSYWGGGLAAAAGCLVFGALPRLLDHPRQRDAILLGLGLALHLITRPYESTFLFLSVALWFAPLVGRAVRSADPFRISPALRHLPDAGLVLLPALALILAHNKSVTGSWTTMPEMLSQYQYGVPAALTFEPDPQPHVPLTPQQALDYKMQLGFRGSHAETIASYLLRLEYRVRYYHFFFPAPLYVALVAFLLCLRHWRYAWVAITLGLFALGVNFFPAFQLHYVAAVTCLFVLVQIAGLERLHRALPEAALLIIFLVLAQFVFWYSLHAFFDTADFSRVARQYETWNFIDHRAVTRRTAVEDALAKVPGKVLLFVRYAPAHIFQDEWVYNRADIDGSRIVWARDLGVQQNEELLRYYPDRSVWLLEPDARPPSLTPYRQGAQNFAR
ncbi:MAG TPA: hypothetical protein VKB88_36715 [Bryobacteraceae bacterium]|nr:hypothetical protein [Bryobacteraceae bacterium]